MTARKPLIQYLRPIGLHLTISGAFILASIGALILYDMRTWGKDIPLILFGSRTGEIMSLGLGATAIHYVLVGGVLLGLDLNTSQRNIIHAIRKTLQPEGA